MAHTINSIRFCFAVGLSRLQRNQQLHQNRFIDRAKIMKSTLNLLWSLFTERDFFCLFHRIRLTRSARVYEKRSENRRVIEYFWGK